MWSIIHGQMDKFGQGTGNIYDAMDLYDSYYTACWRTFAQVRDCMWIHGEKPTFTYSTSAEGNAHPVTLTYDAATGLYTAKLKDTGWCSYTTYRSSSLTYLEEYFTFTAVDDKGNAISGIKFSADDDTLTITATPEALAGSDVITVRVKTPTRGGSSVISVYDSIRYLGEGWQPIITNWEITGTPLYVYMSIQGDPKDPKIETNAYDSDTKTRTSLADKSVTVVDSVIYEDLNAGQTYTATATLMDKSTGKALTVNGKPITASSTFMAYDSSGVVNVPITFDATGQYDKDFVVFEEVTLDGKTVCEHKDLTSAAQTIHTTAAGTITVMKQNANGTAGVSGVTYSITDKNGKAVKDSKGKTLSNITTDKSGCAAWANVPYGDYLITEVKTVDGYSLLADSIPVTMPLAVEGEIKPKDGTRSLYEMGSNTTYLFDLTCTVRDGAVFEMPMTGDKGFVLIPLACLFLSAASFLCLKKKSEPVF